MSLLGAALLPLKRLPADLSLLIAPLVTLVIILAATLWFLRRRKARPAPKPAPRPAPAVASSAPTPGAAPQKSLAERLRELDEIEARHRERTLEEVAKYEKYVYDPLACAALEHFQPVKKNTHCVFAPASRVRCPPAHAAPRWRRYRSCMHHPLWVFMGLCLDALIPASVLGLAHHIRHIDAPTHCTLLTAPSPCRFGAHTTTIPPSASRRT